MIHMCPTVGLVKQDLVPNAFLDNNKQIVAEIYEFALKYHFLQDYQNPKYRVGPLLGYVLNDLKKFPKKKAHWKIQAWEIC